jgi:hypothetical protein
VIRRTATLILAVTLTAGLASCSGGGNDKGATAETTGQAAATAGTGQYKEFDAGCKPLADIQPFMSAEGFNAGEVKKLMEKARAGAAGITEAKVKDAILAFVETPVDAGTKFSDAYTAARKACAEWGAAFSGGKPENSNGNGGTSPNGSGNPNGNGATASTQPGNNSEEVALYKKTCAPVMDIAKSFQEGTLDIASVPKTIDAIAPLVADVPDSEAKSSLQELVDGIDAGFEPMPLFASALQACGAWGSSLSSK